MDKKFKLTVVFGEKAAEYAEESSIEKAIQKIKDGSLYGDYSVYELDTEDDVKVVKRALLDSGGWISLFWE